MPISIGDSTKAAIRRIAFALPYLKAESESAIPIGERGIIQTIRALGAQSCSGPYDVQLMAASAWATVELTKALEADNKIADAEPAPAYEPPVASEPIPDPSPVTEEETEENPENAS